MKDALPSYITKCFTAAGFDTVDVIMKMDVSDDPRNSIEQIEQFIASEHPDLINSKSKRFPPGHRIRIEQFVDSVRQSKKVVKRQYIGPRHKENKKQRMSSTGTSDASHLTDSDEVSDISQIRCQICKRQRTQTNETVRNLKEHQHFDVTVTDTGIAHINCLMCMKKFRLGTKKNKFLISNRPFYSQCNYCKLNVTSYPEYLHTPFWSKIVLLP